LFVLRIVAIAAGLLLAGLVVAWIVTRNRRYLTIAWLAVQIVLLLAIALGLLYVFERVLLL
jgi:apolipoprotein N-acyltransferase